MHKNIEESERFYLESVSGKRIPCHSRTPFLVNATTTTVTHQQAKVVTGSLHLETTRSSATTSSLELAALGSNTRLLARVGTEAEVLESFTGVLGSTQEHGVGTSWGSHCELVEGKSLSSSGFDSCSRGPCEAESGNAQLWKFEEAVVISDSSNNHDSLLRIGLVNNVDTRLDGRDDARDGKWRTVGARHEKSAKHNLVEGTISAASKEAVELDQELQIDIVALGRLAVRRLDVMLI